MHLATEAPGLIFSNRARRILGALRLVRGLSLVRGLARVLLRNVVMVDFVKLLPTLMGTPKKGKNRG